MRTSAFTLLAAVATAYSYGPPSYGSPMPAFNFTGNPFQEYTLSANNINATFIPYGARLTKLFVPDRNGTMQDVALGYDTGVQYLNDTETVHTYFGAVVGRYANRIKNGTFQLDGQTYHIPENEHVNATTGVGSDTLHGGFIGYDQRNWTVAAVSGNSITFMLYDAAYQGFPGDVLNIATYTLTDAPAWISRMVSIPLTDATPIMLANHVYWNLGAFVNEEALTVLNNTLYMPYAERTPIVDGNLIPTGLIKMTNGTALDFTTAKPIGQDILNNSCGTGCIGYDNAFILDRPRYSAPDDPGLEVLQMYAPETGIKLSLETNQQGLQIYTCNGYDGSVLAKKSQQHIAGRVTGYENHACAVIETQDWIDGINYPEWGREQWQIFSPTTQPAINYAKYQFSVVD